MKRKEMIERLEAGEDAMDLSIEKWEQIVAGTEVEFYGTNCALCYEFNDEDENCSECPVREETGENQCMGTPWIDYSMEQTTENAQKMLDYLTDLRDRLNPKPKLLKAVQDGFLEIDGRMYELAYRFGSWQFYVGKDGYYGIMINDSKLGKLASSYISAQKYTASCNGWMEHVKFNRVGDDPRKLTIESQAIMYTSAQCNFALKKKE